jgi:hypothetical protein
MLTSSPVEPDAPQNSIVVAIECPDFVDAQNLPDFDINNTNMSEPQTDPMEIHISGFTLCKEFQETILSIIQAKCQQIVAESSALLYDSMRHSSSDEVQIIQDPSIPDFPPCVAVEERPPSPKEKKRKTLVFVSTLPRRITRSTRFTEATIGWKNMEHTIPILRPLSFVDKEVTITQEPVPSNNMTVTQEPASSQNLVVTQEPAA